MNFLDLAPAETARFTPSISAVIFPQVPPIAAWWIPGLNRNVHFPTSENGAVEKGLGHPTLAWQQQSLGASPVLFL